MNMASESLKHFGESCAKVFAGLLCAALVGSVAAQDRPATASEIDPPGRVGRISEMTGQVWLYSPSAGEWLEAVRNRPITGGDRLATEGAARAELRIGSTTVRLDSGTELEVLRIDDSRIELQLHNGSMTAHLRNREAVEEFEVRTEEGRFRAQRPGRYRIDRIDDTSHLTVNNGSALYEGPGSALTVNSGQRAEFWIDRANVAQYTLTEPKRDAFAAWNGVRDRSDDRNASTRYVSPEMTGVEDLDRHGRWEQSDEYGALWIPRGVAVGWAPYSTGHWVWISPWGWTWVDDAPWGFAPFHYGRWVYYRSNWCWTPGTRVYRPVYAPALVAWVGGPRVSVSVSIGGPVVGWFPLAPREAYVPSYRVSPRYAREVNYSHAPQIASVTQHIGNPQAAPEPRDFSNRKFAHAVTVVPSSVFTQRQPVGPAARSLRERPDAQVLTNEVTRGATLMAAPVAAPSTAAPARTLDAQAITSPGIGNGASAGRPAGPERSAAPGNAPRPWLRPDDERRGAGRGPTSPAVIQATPAAPAIQSVTLPQRSAQPIQPAVPAPAGAIQPNQPVVVAPSSITARPASPGVVGPARPAPAPEGRVRPTRPGNEVPAAPARPEVKPPPAAGGADRGNHAVRQPQPHPDEAPRTGQAARARPAEPQGRERGEPPRQESRREGRERVAN